MDLQLTGKVVIVTVAAHAVKKADEQDGPIPVVETPQMDFWIGTGTAEMNGRPAAVRAKLHAAQEKLRGLYLAQARAAVDASLAEHKK
jgi:putative sterol carrier protein